VTFELFSDAPDLTVPVHHIVVAGMHVRRVSRHVRLAAHHERIALSGLECDGMAFDIHSLPSSLHTNV